MKIELYDFQREDVDAFINEKQSCGLFAYDMALGKTLTATTLAVELGLERVLIIAPKNTYRGWEKAVHTQTEGKQKLQWMKKDTKAGMKAIENYYNGEPGMYFTTWGLMRNGTFFETRVDMVIGDEIHEIQNEGNSAQNIQINHIYTTYKLGLSGTASGNKLAGIYGTIAWLWPSKYKSHWKWLVKHFVLAGVGYAKVPLREIVPGSVTGDLPFYRRRLKEDHYEDLIPKPAEPTQIYVDMSDEQRAIYDQLDATAGAMLDDEGMDELGFVYAPYSITKQMRLREIALGTPVMDVVDDKFTIKFKPDTKSAKLDELIKVLQSEELDGETALVYTHSKRFLKVVVDRLNAAGIPTREYSGDLTTRQKDKNVDELGTKYRVLVATQASVAVGVDGLQHVCRNLMILSRDLKTIHNTQGRDRLYRPGQKEVMRTWEFVARDSNDLDVIANTDYNEEVVNNMLDANKKKRGE